MIFSSSHSPISCNEKIICSSKGLISIEKVPRIENPERIGRFNSHELCPEGVFQHDVMQDVMLIGWCEKWCTEWGSSNLVDVNHHRLVLHRMIYSKGMPCQSDDQISFLTYISNIQAKYKVVQLPRSSLFSTTFVTITSDHRCHYSMLVF